MLLGQLAAGKGLALLLRLDPAVPWRLRGGPRQLHQALVNLIGNAIKFTDKAAWWSCRAPPERGDTVWLRFRSRTQEWALNQARASLFERFARSEDSVRRGISGSGLGLNITRELVHLMGGRVGLSSALGQGSTFWIELPFTVDDQAPAPERLTGRVVVIGGRDLAGMLAERIQGFGCETRCVATSSWRLSCCVGSS